MCIVVLPSGVMVNQIAGVYAGVAIAASAFLPPSSPGMPMLKKPLPAIRVERTRNSRRVIACCLVSAVVGSVVIFSAMIATLLHQIGGAMHGADDARICGAAAQVAVHVRHDFFAGGVGIDGEQRGRLHDLAGLAVAALRNLRFDPGLLHRMRVRRVEPLDGRDDRIAVHVAELDHARAHGLAVYMHGTGTADAETASVLGPREPQILADRPEQRRIGRRVGKVTLTVNAELWHGCETSLASYDDKMAALTTGRSRAERLRSATPGLPRSVTASRRSPLP